MTQNEGTWPAPARAALAAFPKVFGTGEQYEGPPATAWAPGRVNLIGEHTDYNDGFVLPLAVDRVVAFGGRPRCDQHVRLWSVQFGEGAQFKLDDLASSFEEQARRLPPWARYVLAVMDELRKAGVTLPGFDAVLTGDVPVGGGMSSSAALEVATAYACALFSAGRFTIGLEPGATLSPLVVARLCQQAEHRASGVRCGILDQAASCLGQPRKAILLDCRSLEFRYLPFETQQVALVIVDTNVRRELAASAYNERREQCEEAVRLLRELAHQAQEEEAGRSRGEIHSLRDITPAQFARYADQLPAILRKRAGYVIAENERVLEVARLLEAGTIEAVGAYLWQTHAGLRDDYEVSCAELDTLVEIAAQVPGVLGARMMGGGFGGCTINLVRLEALQALQAAIEREYPQRTGRQASIEICRAAEGPGAIWPDRS
jgi:galactokinase